MPPSLRLAIGFLTRLPVGAAIAHESSFGRALGWFPLVGAALGALLLLGALVFESFLAPSLCAAALIAFWAYATGGLHLDGVADVFDAFSGGRGDRERTLEIMRDSRIGAHGAAALALLLLTKLVAVAELIGQGDARLLLACPAVARAALVGLLLRFPYAREQGLGSVFRRHGRTRDGVVGGAVALVACLACGPASLLPGLAALLCAYGVARFSHARLAGLTGDVYGAAIELAELAFLVAACVRWA